MDTLEHLGIMLSRDHLDFITAHGFTVLQDDYYEEHFGNAICVLENNSMMLKATTFVRTIAFANPQALHSGCVSIYALR